MLAPVDVRRPLLGRARRAAQSGVDHPRLLSQGGRPTTRTPCLPIAVVGVLVALPSRVVLDAPAAVWPVRHAPGLESDVGAAAPSAKPARASRYSRAGLAAHARAGGHCPHLRPGAAQGGACMELTGYETARRPLRNVIRHHAARTAPARAARGGVGRRRRDRRAIRRLPPAPGRRDPARPAERPPAVRDVPCARGGRSRPPWYRGRAALRRD